ncbi:MAG: D-alanyl-D-alanine carboxypeptidase family protein [Beijerinckiaceae bacterium]
MIVSEHGRRLLLACAVMLCVLGVTSKVAVAQSIQIASPIAYLYDIDTQSVLYEKAADDLVAPASLVKILTAETVFEALTRGDVTKEQEFLISENVWRRGGAPSGGAAMFAPINTRVAVMDLLQGLIVMSANDAALALAEGMGGHEAIFVERMQKRANAIGLVRSQFRNATGYTHADQKVSAREMAMLAKHMIRTYPEFYALFNQREFTWNKIRQTNRNPLLAMNIGVDGLLTGNNADAGYHIVASGLQDNRRLIAVIMGAENAQMRSAESRKLLEWGFSNFERKKLLDKAVSLTEANVSGGTASVVKIGLSQDLEALMPKSALDPVTVRIQYKGPLKAPVMEGAEVGRLFVMRGQVIALDVPVVALESVPEGSLTKRAWDNSLDWFLSLFRRGWSRS